MILSHFLPHSYTSRPLPSGLAIWTGPVQWNVSAVAHHCWAQALRSSRWLDHPGSTPWVRAAPSAPRATHSTYLSEHMCTVRHWGLRAVFTPAQVRESWPKQGSWVNYKPDWFIQFHHYKMGIKSASKLLAFSKNTCEIAKVPSIESQ